MCMGEVSMCILSFLLWIDELVTSIRRNCIRRWCPVTKLIMIILRYLHDRLPVIPIVPGGKNTVSKNREGCGLVIVFGAHPLIFLNNFRTEANNYDLVFGEMRGSVIRVSWGGGSARYLSQVCVHHSRTYHDINWNLNRTTRSVST